MHELDENGQLGAPGVCFICEQAPQLEAGVRVVDTRRDYQPGVSHLRGRKYVCQPCVGALLVALVPELEAPF